MIIALTWVLLSLAGAGLLLLGKARGYHRLPLGEMLEEHLPMFAAYVGLGLLWLTLTFLLAFRFLGGS
jgi:hypothetical protein